MSRGGAHVDFGGPRLVLGRSRIHRDLAPPGIASGVVSTESGVDQADQFGACTAKVGWIFSD